jgi:hypothetical protein
VLCCRARRTAEFAGDAVDVDAHEYAQVTLTVAAELSRLLAYMLAIARCAPSRQA